MPAPTVVGSDDEDDGDDPTPTPEEPERGEDAAGNVEEGSLSELFGTDDRNGAHEPADTSESEPTHGPDEAANVEEAEAVVEEDDFDDGADLFGEREEASDAPSEDDYDTRSEEVEGDDALGLDGASAATIEDSINDGAARLGVVGLDDETQKQELEGELREVFGAFRLGFFGSRALEEHLLADTEDVDPLWGLAGSALVCAAVTLHMRPDGDEQLANIKDGLGMSDSEDET